MSDWYEGSRREPPQPLTDTLDAVMARIAGSRRGGLIAVLHHWEDLAGPAWEGCEPVAFESGTLVVEVPDGARASLLRFESHSLAAALSARLAPTAVERVAFRVRGR